MNPSVKLGVVLFISFEIAFVQTITTNVVIAVVAALYLIAKRISVKRFAWLLIVPIIPVLGTWLSFYFHGTGDAMHSAWLLSTRVFAYIWLGGVLTFTCTPDELLGSLEQNCHLPAKFVYGMLGAFNFAPQVTQAVKQIKTAALMRGEVLHVWSPQIFFKAVLLSLRWSDNLAQSMQSHGFNETTQRTHYQRFVIPAWNWGLAVVLLAGVQFFTFGHFK